MEKYGEGSLRPFPVAGCREIPELCGKNCLLADSEARAFCPPQTAKIGTNLRNSEDICLGIFSFQPAKVREQRGRCDGRSPYSQTGATEETGPESKRGPNGPWKTECFSGPVYKMESFLDMINCVWYDAYGKQTFYTGGGHSEKTDWKRSGGSGA